MPRSLSHSHSRGSRAQGANGRGGGSDGHDGGGGGGGGGKPVKIAFAPNQVEAEMIQGLLSEHGIPSMLKRGPGFDVPEFMSAGPRQVFVAEGAARKAREVLEGTPGGS
jgi:Putative prokaryotic signal transducing protein